MAIGTPTSLGTPVASAVTATTRTFTTSVAAPSNSLIVAVCTWGAGSAVAGTFSGGGLTWSTDQTNSFNFGFVFSIGIFSAPAPSGLASGSVLTLTGAAGIDANISVCYVTGMDLSGTRKDVSHGQGASTANWDSGAATTTNADDLLIGGSLIDGSATATAMTSTPAAGETELFDWINSGDDWASTVAYQIVSATGSQSISGTWAASANQVSGFVAYKAAAASGTQVSATRAISYSIAAQVSATRALTYSIAAQVSATRAINYSISKQVAATRALTYAILTQVSGTRALSYAILAQIAATRGLSYDILNAATHVAGTRALKYDLIAPVSATRALNYNLLAQIAATRALKYDLLKSVAATRALNYNLLAQASTTRRLTYSIGVVTVHGDLMLLWLM
jgi:hypothetical protein